MQETGVPSLTQEDPLEEGMATHSSILAWRISMDRGTWGCYSPQGHKESNMTEQLSTAYRETQLRGISKVFCKGQQYWSQVEV